jgi:ABC-type glutathione transport system ATPase component
MPNPIKVVKGLSKGAAKVKKRVQNLNEIAEYRTGGNVSFDYRKGKLTDVSGGTGSGKVKPRNLGKATKQMAPSSKKATKKYKMEKLKSEPKVPVKKRGK